MAANAHLRTIALVAAGVLLGGLLAPVTAAATTSLVTLFDPRSDSRARIDDGELRIGDGSGPLTVDGSVRSNSGLDDRQLVNVALSGIESNTTVVNTDPYVVPASSRLVVTTVSVWASCNGSGEHFVRTAALNDDVVFGPYLAMQHRASDGFTTTQLATHPIARSFPPGSSVYVQVQWLNNCTTSASTTATIHGYLVRN